MTKLSIALLTLILSNSIYAQSIDKIQQKQIQERQRHKAEVKAAMRACTAVTQDGDWRGRNLSRNVQVELGETCVVKKPSLDSIKLLNKQINSAFQVVNATELWNDINTIALKRTVKSVWATHIKLIKDEKFNEASAVGLICKYTPRLCKNKGDLRSIKLAFQSFQKEIAKKPVKFLSGPEQAAILKNELQPLINRANKTCDATKKKYNEIKLAHSCVRLRKFSKDKDGKFVMGKPVQPMSTGECQGQIDAAYAKHRQLESIATEGIEMDMQLIVGSQLGSLLITEDLREKMGVLKNDFAFKNCMKGDGSILKQVWNKDLLKARNDFYALTVKELKKIDQYKSEDSSDYSKKQTLKQYLKTNPSTVAELLNNHPDKNKAYAMCSLIKTIQGWDKAGKIVDGVIIGTGVVASIALGFTGVGAPAGAVLAGVVLGSSAITVAKSAIDYSAQIHQDERLRTAVATKQKNFDQALTDLKASDIRKEALLDNIKFTAVAEAAGFGLGKGLKLIAQYRQARNLKALSQAAAVVEARRLETAAQAFKQHATALGPKASQLTKLTLAQEAEVAHLIASLDAKQASLFTKKMSQLKTSDEITAFLKSVRTEKGALELKQLNRLVDGSKVNPPMSIKVERNPGTSALYAKLTVEEQKRLVKAARDMKIDDASLFRKISSIQENCLAKGVFKRGCFQAQLTKIERDIAANSIHKYMEAGYAKILDKAKVTEEAIRTSTKPVVYDVVSIGSGPHNGIAINAMKDVDPNLKILVIDKSQNLGVFHQVKGFDINTPEYLKHSGNTFPGSPTQLKDFNVDKRIYATAEELGEQTQATYRYADADIVFKNQVLTVTKAPTPGAWPAKWKIETNKGLVVYSKAGISAQGFGDFATRLKDAKSIEVVEKYHTAYMTKDLVKDAKYSPPISSVDDLIPAIHQDTKLGRVGVDRFDDGETILVVGAGDGGNIAIEALTGLNKKLNPTGAVAKTKITWLSQEAKTGEEYVKTLSPRTTKRYARIGKTIDSKQVEPINGYLARIEEFIDANGNVKFKAYYTTKTGEAIGEPIIAKNIVFSTGYPNNQSHITPIFNRMAKDPAAIEFKPIVGDIDDYTRYPQFNQEETFTSRQLTVNGQAEDWFSVGVGGKIPASNIEKTQIPVGGSLDVLAPKSASTGKMIAEKISTNTSSKSLVVSYEKPQNFTLKQRPSTKTQYKFDNEAVVNIDMKLQVGKSLRGHTISPNAEIAVVVSKNKAGLYHFEVQGLDKASSQALVTELGKNSDLTHDLNSYFKMGKSNIEIKVGSRATGQLKLEDLHIRTSSQKIISSVTPAAPNVSPLQYGRENVQLQVKASGADGHMVVANQKVGGENMGYAMIDRESNIFTKDGKLLDGYDVDVSVPEAFKGQKMEDYLLLNSAVELQRQGKTLHSTHDLSAEMKRAWEAFEKQGIATRKKAMYMNQEVEFFEFNTKAITSRDLAGLEENIRKAKLTQIVPKPEVPPAPAP